jgi:hypothetical protein
LTAAKDSFKTAYRLAKEQSVPDLSRYLEHVERIEKRLSAHTPPRGDS